jgi:hypothetical protein
MTSSYNINTLHKWDREDFITYFGSDKDYDLYREAYFLYYDDMDSKGEKFIYIFKSFIRNKCCDKYLNIVKSKHRKEKIEDLLDDKEYT